MKIPFRPVRLLTKLGVVVLSLHCGATALRAAPTPVRLVPTPNEGIQPQATLDERGVLHLIYFKGKPSAGDVFYARQEPGKENFSQPFRVNSRPGSAIAVGSIRGAHMALGKNGRVHVAWMGSDKAEPAMIDGQRKTPMVYTRLNDQGTAFEPERNVLTWAAGLDGGGSVAADARGNVYVAWHASTPDNKLGEAGRAVFVARSADEGKTFTREKLACPAPTGACGCCGMRAFADANGALYLLYRAATERVGRDMTLLVSRRNAEDFQTVTLSKWKLMTCPMSSSALSQGPGSVLAAWETEGQVKFARINADSLRDPQVITPAGTGKRKHPSAAQNSKGETLLAWTENTGWEKGGSLAWQLFDQAGNPIGDQGRADGVKTWSLVSTVAKADGSFVILY